MRILTLAAIALVPIATPAFAQSDPQAPFTGPRAGAILGYDGIRPGSTQDSAIGGDRAGADGFLYGGDIGYDLQQGRAVFGIEGEVTGSTGNVSNSPRDTAALGFGRVKAGRDLYVGGRAGLLVGARTLGYVKGGYTNARLDLTASDGTTETGRGFNLDGYRVGAGIEHQLTPRTYAKVEYRYSNYGSARLEFPRGANTNNFGIDTDRHQVVAGVGFRF
ncbi:MAG: outer membrane protein [Sphingomonas sp.]